MTRTVFTQTRISNSPNVFSTSQATNDNDNLNVTLNETSKSPQSTWNYKVEHDLALEIRINDCRDDCRSHFPEKFPHGR